MSLAALTHYVSRADGLRFPTVNGRQLLPGDALEQSQVYQQVRASSARMRQFAALATGKNGIHGQRVDSSRKNVAADSRLAGVLAEWAGWLASGGAQQMAGGRTDSVDDIGRQLAARVDALVPMGSQGLVSFIPEVYEYQHAGLNAWSGSILPIDKTSVDRAAETYVWYERDLVGVARVGNSYSTMDIPMVTGPIAQSNQGKIVPALVGMETNFMDDRRAALGIANGKPDFMLQQGKVQACNEALAQWANALWLYGDPILGIDGLQNHPLVATISLTGGAWATATAAQINSDLVTILNTIPNAAQGAIGPGAPGGGYSKIKIMLPFAQYQRAANLIVSSAGDKSVLKYFMENNNLREDQVVQVWDFSAVNSQIYTGGPNGLSVDRGVVVYEAGDGWDPKFLLPQPIEMPAPPRQNGTSETTFYHLRAGGMMVADARRIRYIEGF